MSLRAPTGVAALTGERGPASIGGLLRWLDGSATAFQDAAATLPANSDGDPVGCWPDQSFNGVNATQSTASKRATVKLAVQNGRNVIRFDGVDDFFALALAVSQPITLFVVAKSAANKVLLDGDDATDRVLWYSNSGGNWEAFAGSSLTAEARADAFHQHTVIYNGASSVVRKNGVETAAGAVGAKALSGVTIGDSYLRDGSNAFSGDMAEIIAYSGALLAADYQAIELFQKNKWATP